MTLNTKAEHCSVETYEGAELRLEKMVHGGRAMGYHDGSTFFVKGGLSQELVSICKVQKKGKVFMAEVEDVLEPSPFRRSSPCDHFGKCGGCDWLHIEHLEQLKFKEQIFRDGLKRMGGLQKVDDLEVEVHHGSEWAYRHRAQFRIDDSGRCGFYAERSHQVVEIDQCPVLVPELQEMLQAVREKGFAYFSRQRSASKNKKGKGKRNHIHVENKALQVKAMSGSLRDVATYPTLSQESSKTVKVLMGSLEFEVHPNGFFQQNRDLTEVMGRWVADVVSFDQVVDLYGGSGFFSMMLAERASRVLLVERDRHLVDNATEHFKKHGFDHLRAVAMPAEEALSQGSELQLCPETTVVVDPPRGGLGAAVCECLNASELRELIYVACDPATQARDLKWLREGGRFVLQKAAMFDLYPGTHHMETVLVLKR